MGGEICVKVRCRMQRSPLPSTGIDVASPPRLTHVVPAEAPGAESCVQMLSQVQLSPMPSTDTAAAASTDTDICSGSRSTVDTAMHTESCVQVLCRMQLSPSPSTGVNAASTPTPTPVVPADPHCRHCCGWRELCPSALPNAALADWHQRCLHTETDTCGASRSTLSTLLWVERALSKCSAGCSSLQCHRLASTLPPHRH